MHVCSPVTLLLIQDKRRKILNTKNQIWPSFPNVIAYGISTITEKSTQLEPCQCRIRQIYELKPYAPELGTSNFLEWRFL